IDVVTEQRIEALVSSDDDDINDQLVYLPSAPDIEDPDIDITLSITKNQILTQNFIETDQKYEIQLQIPPIYDTHPYYGGTKQTRSIGNIPLNNHDIKKHGRHRRKGYYNNNDQQNILLPKSIDTTVVTITKNSKRFISTNGNSTIVTQTSENKGQRGRSARLEGKKTTTSQHRSSTDNDIDFVPH
ncbi:unnamed protein product, partial [Rotaria sp. Silwood1]